MRCNIDNVSGSDRIVPDLDEITSIMRRLRRWPRMLRCICGFSHLLSLLTGATLPQMIVDDAAAKNKTPKKATSRRKGSTAATRVTQSTFSPMSVPHYV